MGAVSSPFTLWQTSSNGQNEFQTSTGAYATNVDWTSSAPWNYFASGGNTVVSSAESLVALASSEPIGVGIAPPTYNIVLAARDNAGDVQNNTVTVATTAMVNPFPNGRIVGALVYNIVGNIGYGIVGWWQASTSVAGAYDLEAEAFTENFSNLATSTQAITLSGNVVTLAAGQTLPSSAEASTANWGFGYTNNGTALIAYTAAASSTTSNIDYVQFTPGAASATITNVSSIMTLASNVTDGEYVDLAPNKSDQITWTENNGASSGFYSATLNTAGAVTSTKENLSESTYSQVFSSNAVSSTTLNTTKSLFFVDGIRSGTQYIDVYLQGTSTPVTSFALSSTSFNGMMLASVLDKTTGQTDETTIAYYDNGLIHLELVNSAGQQIGSDFTISGATSFVGLRSLGDTRVVVTYLVADPNGGNDTVSTTYDTATIANTVTINDTSSGGYGIYSGTPFNDTFTFGAGQNILAGGGGTDTLMATTLSSYSVNLSVNAQGNVYLTDYSSDSDLLENFSYIYLSDATVGIVGNTLTFYYQNGSVDVRKYNITGQPYTYEEDYYSSSVNLQSITYSGYASSPYQSMTNYYSGKSVGGSPNLIQTTYIYVNQASGLLSVSYMSGALLELNYAPTGGATWSDLQIDYVGGQLADYAYQFNGPGGSSYASFTEYFDALNAYQGVQFNYILTSGAWSTEQVAINAANKLTEIDLQSNGSSGNVQELSYFYNNGAANGYGVTYNISSQSFTSETVDYNQQGQLTSVNFSGYSGSTLKQITDLYTGGVQTAVLYIYGNLTDNNVEAYAVLQNTSSVTLGTYYRMLNGTQVLDGATSNYVMPTIGGDSNNPFGGVYGQGAYNGFSIPGGLWSITAGGGGDTFTFDPYFNSATITDYGTYFATNAEIISVSTADFANWTAMLGDAKSSGGGANTTFTAANGDALTLDGVTLTQLQGLTPTQSAKLFTFHS